MSFLSVAKPTLPQNVFSLFLFSLAADTRGDIKGATTQMERTFTTLTANMTARTPHRDTSTRGRSWACSVSCWKEERFGLLCRCFISFWRWNKVQCWPSSTVRQCWRKNSVSHKRVNPLVVCVCVCVCARLVGIQLKVTNCLLLIWTSCRQRGDALNAVTLCWVGSQDIKMPCLLLFNSICLSYFLSLFTPPLQLTFSLFSLWLYNQANSDLTSASAWKQTLGAGITSGCQSMKNNSFLHFVSPLLLGKWGL